MLLPEVIDQRARLGKAKRYVIKIGSALLTNEGRGLDEYAINDWVRQLIALKKSGIEVVLVSSGAIAQGMVRLGLKSRPNAIHLLQAAAAVGQTGLVQAYESSFGRYGLHTAQVLLTHDDLSDRKRYLNARVALSALLSLNVIPIINENDTVVTDEIRFGDNDTIAALVTNLIEAQVLVLLTDQAGLFESDPRLEPQAKMITQASAFDEGLINYGGESRSGLGQGGMITKIRAARLAARSGAATVIASGRVPDVLRDIVDQKPVGTLLYPDQEPLAARKQWLVGHLQMKGHLVLDTGAVKVLVKQGKSLLPVGVVAVSGEFKRGEMVACEDEEGRRIACGLVNYDAVDAKKIMGCSSEQVSRILGQVYEVELIHRDNMVITL